MRLWLDAAHTFETRVGLALVPTAVILAVVLLLYHQARRHEQQRLRAVDDTRRRERQQRDSEIEGLSRFGGALARASDMGVVRDVVQQSIPWFVGERPVWAVVRGQGKWESIAGGLGESSGNVLPEIEQLADQALRLLESHPSGPDGVASGGRIYYPLVVGETPIGVMAVETTSEDRSSRDADWRRATGAAATLVAIAARNVQLAREVEENGVYDGVTGCFNRTHAMRLLETELQRARRQETPLALIMLDLDHFKAVNDTHGHLCGDALLTAVGQRIRDTLRNSDTKCRYGGEEFLVVLPDTPRRGALHVAEALRQQLAELSVTWIGEKVSVTASVGLAMAMPTEGDAMALIGRADAALYRAKKGGRNQVCETELPEAPVAAAPQAV